MFGVATVLDLWGYYPVCRSLYKGHSEPEMIVWAFLSLLAVGSALILSAPQGT